MKVTKKGNIKQDGVTYKAEPKQGCEGCAFDGEGLCRDKPCAADERLVVGFKHYGQSVIFVEKPAKPLEQLVEQPKTPSDAAKAAAILYHTYGVESSKDALAIYDQWEQLSDSEVETFLENDEWGVWEGVEHMDSELLWGSIVSLAQSIDTCRELP